VSRPRIATVWLGGCAGCHMSLLDTDEWLLALAERADVVFSPLADVKEFPRDVDVTLVEGAVANTDNLEMAKLLRDNSRVVVSLGDCAVTGNVTSLRNPLGDSLPLLQRVYVDAVDRDGALPDAPGIIPQLLPQVLPLHHVITVDVFLPGCPPQPDDIRCAVEHLLDGTPAPAGLRFG
jgi:NAD-reducing hydrogenase small subunit